MYIITFHYIPYHYVGVSHCLTIFLYLYVYHYYYIAQSCEQNGQNEGVCATSANWWFHVTTISYNRIRSVCIYSILHLSVQCVYFTLYIMCEVQQLLLPSGRLPPPLIESNQINHKNKWYSHLVIPKCVVIWLLDTHKPWLFQYEYEWVRILFLMITNTISNFCFIGIQNVEIQTRAICVDCTEEFVSNEVIRVVLPTGEHEREPLYHWVELMNSLSLDLPLPRGRECV